MIIKPNFRLIVACSFQQSDVRFASDNTRFIYIPYSARAYQHITSSLDRESSTRVRHEREGTSISANKIPKSKPVPLRPPVIKGRKLVDGGAWTHIDPHFPASFDFGILFAEV